jgi:hypothetical protein
MLMMDDPLSLLMQGIWLLAAGMYPLGFMFGTCSACCGCPWILNFDRCLLHRALTPNSEGLITGGTESISMRKVGGTGQVQYMESGSVGSAFFNSFPLEIHYVQSQIQIPVRISISASGESRTPIGNTRTQVWRFSRATPTSPLTYDVLGPAWHLEVELSVTGVATQAESGVSTAVGADSEGQSKLFVVVNQWTSTITHDESVTLSPVGLQRWGPGISGTQSFRLTQLTATATRVAGENYSGWTVSKLSGITISGRELAVRINGRVFLNEQHAVEFLNGDRTLTGSTRELSILPNNVLCNASAGEISLGVALGIYPTSLTWYPSPSLFSAPFLGFTNGVPQCDDTELSVFPQNECSGYISRYTRFAFDFFQYTFSPAGFFCGGTILYNLIHGPCRSSVNNTGTVALQSKSPQPHDAPFLPCPGGMTDIDFGLCVGSISATVEYDGGVELSMSPGFIATFEEDGRARFAFSGSKQQGNTLYIASISAYIDDPCADGGTVTFGSNKSLQIIVGILPPFTVADEDFDIDPGSGPSWQVAERGETPTIPSFTPIGACAMTSVTVDGITPVNNVSTAALVAGQCVYARANFSTAKACAYNFDGGLVSLSGSISHSVPCGGCVPEVNIVAGSEYARVVFYTSGDKAGVIEIVAATTWLGGQGVTFTVTCGTDSITHTIRRADTAPLAPVLLSVTRGPCSDALLQWSIEWDGGQPITAYTVQFRRIGVTAWTTFGTVAPPALSAVVTGLVRVGYEFRVSATNSVGTSAFSNIVADGFALAAPTGLTVVRTPPCTSAQLSWTPPAQAECVVVAAYQLQLRVAGTSAITTAATVPGDATTGTISGLTAGTRYEFRVGSVDEADVVRVTPLITSGLLPLVPTNVTASLGTNPGEVDLTWSHSDREECFPATDFNVQIRPSTTTTWSDVSRPASTDTFTTVTGLTAGVAYFFRVRAVNSVGNSSFSTQSPSILIPLPE